MSIAKKEGTKGGIVGEASDDIECGIGVLLHLSWPALMKPWYGRIYHVMDQRGH